MLNNQITYAYIEKSIAYCGLVCAFCSASTCKTCSSCMNKSNDCCQSDEELCNGCRTKVGGCDIKTCCVDKNINGCWECESFLCGKSIHHNIRVRAFLRCAKEDGLKALAEFLWNNANSGIRYHGYHGTPGDYDILKSEEEILRLLRTGAK
ncbi:hypothetical protein R50345_16150 [Paenibacillus sp. FSL R5-0345]|nr:hypothetical protein R50345_16150 [Paenibacillus sp. FSL R5-0345]